MLLTVSNLVMSCIFVVFTYTFQKYNLQKNSSILAYPYSYSPHGLWRSPSWDRHDWRETRGKWSLARNPDRSWWHRHTSLKLFCSSPGLHGQEVNGSWLVQVVPSVFLCSVLSFPRAFKSFLLGVSTFIYRLWYSFAVHFRQIPPPP